MRCIILIVNANANDSHIDLRMHYWVDNANKGGRRVLVVVFSA